MTEPNELSNLRCEEPRSAPASVDGASEIDATSAWPEVVAVFGKEIQRLRQAQALSLDHIRLKTHIPVYQLEALEAGVVADLPEEIFVRGFLHRICGELGCDGAALLNQLPASQSEPSAVLALWQQSKTSRHSSSQILHLRSAHLYVSYAALLAGAAGGLALSFQDAAQVSQPLPLHQPSTAQKAYSQARFRPGRKASQLRLGIEIAPPEADMPESSDSP